MFKDLQTFITCIPDQEIDLFISNTRAKATVKKSEEKVTVDFSWVEQIEEAIPFLDNIIHNPHIEREENPEYLAAMVDLYENRFIYSLINNLYIFVQKQLVYIDDESFNQLVKTINYQGTTNYNHEDISISLELKSINYNILNSFDINELHARIKHIIAVLNDFKKSKFMQIMAPANPVKSPIKKINAFLNENAFMAALNLWDFLEDFQITAPLKKWQKEEEQSSAELNKDFTLTYFMNYNILNGLNKKYIDDEKSQMQNLKKVIFDYAKNFNIDENELRKQINNELRLASLFKEEQIKGINTIYKSFINDHTNRLTRGLTLLK